MNWVRSMGLDICMSHLVTKFATNKSSAKFVIQVPLTLISISTVQ